MEGSRSFFAPGGVLSAAHPGYEYRPGQEEMARAVARTIEAGGSLLVEAGTGTGKTLAYLVPALESGRRVVVSTGTRNLQDQIFNQDLPFLRDRVGREVSACLMKGRANYLCRYRFSEFVSQPLLETRDEERWIAPIREWSTRTRTGDRAEIAALPDGLRMWRDINARAETCTGTRCPEYEDCWLTTMKRRAQQSQVIVVNHHLFFADLAVRTAFGSVIPDYDTVVFDEAHLLEEIATLYFGVQVSAAQIEDLARDIESVSGRRSAAARGGAGAARLREAAREFFLPVRERLGETTARMRFEPAERGGLDLSGPWSVLSAALAEAAREASATVSRSPGETSEAVEERAKEIRSVLDRILARDDGAFVYGMERRGRSNVILSAAPIDVSRSLRERLFDGLHAAVLTSATLAVEGRFDFFRKRLGLDDAPSLVVGSPFDHERQAVLYLPPGMPEPRQPDFVERALEEIRGLLRITRGRAFLLFTSYGNLERVHGALRDEGAWPLLVQGEGSKVALVESFKTTPGAVLLGTTSFWHGVDVPGEALSLVVVDKLPFDVPSDPLVAARIERIKSEGGNAFEEYQLPLAALELKQGLGRLLRSRGDRGILSVLDPRLTTRRYGRAFLASLPPHPVVRERAACEEFFGRGGA